MTEQPSQFEALELLGRYARGELGAAQIEDLTRRVSSDPELRSLWTEYQISCSLDGSLSPQELADLTTRVQADETLAAAMADYQALDAAVEKLSADELEFDLLAQREGILSAIENRQASRQLRIQRWVVKPVLAAMAVAAVFVLAFGVYLMTRSEALAPTPAFQVSLVPPAQTPAATGEVEVKMLPGTAQADVSAGTVVAVAGSQGAPAVAQGMSSYMMLACCAGMPPQAGPAAGFSPLLQQAWACVSWLMDKDHRNQLQQLTSNFEEM